MTRTHNLIFVDRNKELVKKIRSLGFKAYTGDIFKYSGVIVSASNPMYTFGGGLDAQIFKKYPYVCYQVRKGRNQRIENIIFTITVDKNFKSNPKLVKKALQFAKENIKPRETLLISGLGTGIGGLSIDDFVNCFSSIFTKATRERKGVSNKTVKTTPSTKITIKSNQMWKFLREGMKSENGDCTWKIGQWKHQEGKIDLCNNGFHASRGIYQAFSYVQGEVVAIVEVKGESDIQEDKEAWSDMRIVRAFKWEKKDSVGLAIFAAEQVIDIYQKQYPNDDRPRKAIDAAKKWLKNPTDKNRAAAWAAGDAARDAAGAAVRAAWAAWAAAGAAGDAAGAAVRDAARAASEAGLIKRISDWIDQRVSQLEEIR